jgi:hypothetical protein
MRFKALLDMFHHGPPHAFKDAGVVEESFFVVYRSCTHKGSLRVPTGNDAENSNTVYRTWRPIHPS